MKKQHTNISFVFFIVMLLTFTTNLAYSQGVTEEEINDQFDDAVTLFDSGKFNEALIIFDKIISDYSYNSKTTA